MSCRAQYPWVFGVFLGVTLDSTETPFAKTPFLVPEFRKVGKPYMKVVLEVVGDEI